MKANLELIHGSFLFVEDFSLSLGTGSKEVDISSRSDVFKAAIGKAILFGQVKSDINAKDIISSIRDNEFRSATEVECGFKESVKFKDIEKAPVEIVEATIEEDNSNNDNNNDEDDLVDGPEEDNANVASIEIPVAQLQEILKGNIAAVAKKVKEAKLSEAEVAKLIQIEETGKNRATILSMLKDK
jgi:hypothetical protein